MHANDARHLCGETPDNVRNSIDHADKNGSPNGGGCLVDFSKQFRKVRSTDAVGWTLRDVFQNVYLPARPLAKSTRAGYESTLTRWERITGNPTMGELSDPEFDLDVFVEFVKLRIVETRLDGSAAKMSPAAANKEIRQLQAILAFCGPKGLGNRQGRGFIPAIPFFDRFDEPEPNPRFLSLDELDSIYRACCVARWPRYESTGIDPGEWWRSAIVYLSNCGTRTVDWLTLRTDDVDLKTGVVTLRREQKTGKSHRLPLARCVVDHLAEFWTNREFVWPAPKNKRDRNATFRAIQSEAGIAEPYRLKDLRSTCGDRWYAIEPTAARGVLNHSNQLITERHYARKAEHDFARLSELAETIEQPPAFMRGKPTLRVVR